MKTELLRIAEDFRQRATKVEVAHGRESWLQSVNVILAFEQCAEEIEALANAQSNPQPEANAS